jgi:hypothetical protein
VQITNFLPFVLSMFTVAPAMGQAGPPFRTDDPETPGDKNWEINLGWIGDRNPYQGYYSIPNFDINYGLGDRVQLKYELPIAVHELLGGVDNSASSLLLHRVTSMSALANPYLESNGGSMNIGPREHRQREESPMPLNPTLPWAFIRSCRSTIPPVQCGVRLCRQALNFCSPSWQTPVSGRCGLTAK